jgi:hypothetical protein
VIFRSKVFALGGSDPDLALLQSIPVGIMLVL